MAEKKAFFEQMQKAAKGFGEGVKDVAGKAAAGVKDVAEKAAEGAKEGADRVAQLANQAKIDYDKRRLRPVFVEDLVESEKPIGPMIRIIESDKDHEENPVCTGSIGFMVSAKEMDVLNIYKKDADTLGIKFYPYPQEDVYYIDPSDKNLFISLDEYFGFLKKARVDELVMIAHKLGAKHVVISLRKKAKAFTNIKATGGAGAGKVKGDAKVEVKTFSDTQLEVIKELDFEGGEPIKPDLKYFKDENEILDLVEMRVNKHNPTKHVKSTMKYSNTAGIKSDAAVKIDAALAKMKIKGNASVKSETESEERLEFEYEIFF